VSQLLGPGDQRPIVAGPSFFDLAQTAPFRGRPSRRARA
jgi:hypothetical protein